MPASDKATSDIETLMARIRKEVAQRRNSSVTGSIDSIPKYIPGSLLRFGAGGNAGPYLRSGWSTPEPEFRWSDGEVAEVALSFVPPLGDFVLSITAEPFITAGVEHQLVWVSWNDVAVGEWLCREARTYHTLVFANLLASSPNGLLKLHFPNCVSPLSKGASADPRRLGLAVHELVLRPASDLGF